MTDVIPVFIGISRRFDCVKGMTARSIVAHTNASVHITHLYPEVEEGCTGFTHVRYTVTRGIYLDCDMIVLGDIAELWSYRREGEFVCMWNGASEVAVIDTDHACRTKREEHLIPKRCQIPAWWNVEDEVIPGAKLVHMTNLKTQPWVADHPDPAVTALYNRWRPASAVAM